MTQKLAYSQFFCKKSGSALKNGVFANFCESFNTDDIDPAPITTIRPTFNWEKPPDTDRQLAEKGPKKRGRPFGAKTTKAPSPRKRTTITLEEAKKRKTIDQKTQPGTSGTLVKKPPKKIEKPKNNIVHRARDYSPPQLTEIERTDTFDFTDETVAVKTAPVKTFNKKRGHKKRAKNLNDLYNERLRHEGHSDDSEPENISDVHDTVQNTVQIYLHPILNPNIQHFANRRGIEYYNSKNRPSCPACDGDTEYETSDDDSEDSNFLRPRYQTYTSEQQRNIWRKKWLNRPAYKSRETDAHAKHARDKIQCNSCAQWFHFTCLGGPKFFVEYQKSPNYREIEPICGQCNFDQFMLQFKHPFQRYNTKLKNTKLVKNYYSFSDRVPQWM